MSHFIIVSMIIIFWKNVCIIIMKLFVPFYCSSWFEVAGTWFGLKLIPEDCKLKYANQFLLLCLNFVVITIWESLIYIYIHISIREA